MILHEDLIHPRSGAPQPWIAFHVPSLTFAECRPVSGDRISITPLILPGPPPTATSATASTSAAGPAMAAELLSQKDYPSIINALAPPSEPLEEYILVNSLDLSVTGILHTTDPIALYFPISSDGTLGNAQAYTVATDLPATGWEYWWEDAQRAFYRLILQSYQDAGRQVPRAVAATQ